jgi:tetratricopeptide (TPR) repeat protein
MNRSTRLTWLVGVCVAAGLLCACGNAQSRKASYIAHGKTYFIAANYDKARVEFSNASQIDPRDAEVRFLQGQVSEKLGDVRGAVGQYQAAISADPNQAGARAALGRLFLYGGLADKAMDLVEPGLTADPKNPQLLTVRGAARARLGDAQSALQDAQMAVQLAPGDEYAIALLASLYKQRSDLDKAVAVVQAGLQLLPNDVDLRSILADLDVTQQQPAAAEAQLRRIIDLEPKVPAHRYLLARFYLQQKNVDAAEKTLRDAVSNLPDNIDAKLQLAGLLAAQRGPDQAADQVDRFLAAEPNNDKLRLVLGEFLAQDNHADAAERAFRAVIAHAGTGVDGLAARDQLTSLLIGRNDVTGASALIAQVLQQNARDNDALILRGNISLAQGKVQAAINDLRAVLRDQPNSVGVMRTLAQAYKQNNEPDLAEETLRAAVQISPKDFQSRLQLAQVLVEANKLDQGEPVLEQLAKDDPNNIAAEEALFRVQAAQKRNADARATAEIIQRVSPKQGLGYYLAGLIDEADQKPDAAAKDYEQSLQRQPAAGEPLAALVRLDLQLKRAPAATALVDGVIAHSPDNAMARNIKAEMLLAQGQTDAAIAAYQDTVHAAPTWVQGYRGLARAQFVAKRNDDAIRSLQLGIEKAQNPTPLIGDLSELYQRLGRVDDAIAMYENVLAKTPSSSFAANNLAMLLVTYRQDAASLARAQKLADQLGSSSEVSLIDTRGWVKFKTGDFHSAESLLQQAVDKAPTAAELRYHLGMAQLRSGEQQAAQQNLEAALRSDHPFAGMDEAKAALAQLKKSASVG